MGDWTFFSNYGHVLVCLARDREARLRDVALQVGITERAVQKIVSDLQAAGFVTVTKQGRCNRYRINRRKSLRHALESHCTVGKLLNLIAKKTPDTAIESAVDTEMEKGTEDRTLPVPSTDAPLPAMPAQPQDEKMKDKDKDKAAEKQPVPDTRQQGSLF